MGQIGVRSVLNTELSNGLRRELERQRREYDVIECEAHSIEQKNRWNVKELNPAIRFMTDRMAKMHLSSGNPESKAAAMMIQGNTRGIIKGLKNLHHTTNAESDVVVLAKKLIETECQNIDQMKPYI